MSLTAIARGPAPDPERALLLIASLTSAQQRVLCAVGRLGCLVASALSPEDARIADRLTQPESGVFEVITLADGQRVFQVTPLGLRVLSVVDSDEEGISYA